MKIRMSTFRGYFMGCYARSVLLIFQCTTADRGKGGGDILHYLSQFTLQLGCNKHSTRGHPPSRDQYKAEYPSCSDTKPLTMRAAYSQAHWTCSSFKLLSRSLFVSGLYRWKDGWCVVRAGVKVRFTVPHNVTWRRNESCPENSHCSGLEMNISELKLYDTFHNMYFSPYVHKANKFMKKRIVRTLYWTFPVVWDMLI